MPGTAVAQVNDPIGDFISTFAGPNNGDLDVVSSTVVFAGTEFFLTTTLNGAVGTTSNALYVWGFDRGQGTARFAGGGSPIPGTENILFDSVVILRPDTTVTINRIVGGGATNLPVGTATVQGNTISAKIPVSTLPTLGFALADYTWNLWPRAGVGQNSQVSDFAPDASNIGVNVAPEPGTAGLMLGGGLLMWGVIRRKQVR
jgi:hypothetical protein